MFWRNTPEKRVDRSVALLDERMPGWADKIYKKVDLTSYYDCILGQLYGSFEWGLHVLGIVGQSRKYGFIAFPLFREETRLTFAWNKAIEERKNKRVVIRRKEFTSPAHPHELVRYLVK